MDPCFRLWGRSCSCAMEKKKGDCFPVRGAFWENRGSAYRSQPSKGFEGALTSPLLKFFHPSKRATSSHIRERFTCRSLTTAVQPHGCKKPRSGLCSGSWEMFNQGALSPPTHTPNSPLGGTLTSRHILHVFIISLTPPHGLHPAMKSRNLWLCPLLQGSSRSPAHLDGAQRRNSFLVFI